MLLDDFLRFLRPNLDDPFLIEKVKKSQNLPKWDKGLVKDEILQTLGNIIVGEIEYNREFFKLKEKLYWSNGFDVTLAFKAVDVHDSGFIDAVSLKNFMTCQKQRFTPDDLMFIIQKIGDAQDLVITFVSFCEHFETFPKKERSRSRSSSLRRKYISPVSAKLDEYRTHKLSIEQPAKTLKFYDKSPVSQP